MTKSQRVRPRRVIRSCASPSARTPGSPIDWNGRIAIDGFCDRRQRLVERTRRLQVAHAFHLSSRRRRDRLGLQRSTTSTSPTKRKPRLCTVLISRCDLPSSPIACRAAFTRLESAASETMRPRQTASRISSRLTTRSRFSTRYTSSAKTCGSTGNTDAVAAQLLRGGVDLECAETVDHGRGRLFE